MKRTVYDEMHQRITSAFRSTNLGDVIAIMQEYFGQDKYTIWHLFRDEKRKILEKITAKSMHQAETTLRDLYNDNYQLMTGMLHSGIPVPEAYQSAVKYVVNRDLNNFFQRKRLKPKVLNNLLQELKKWNVSLAEQSSFKYEAGERIFQELQQLKASEISLERIKMINQIFSILKSINVEADIWKSQNLYFNLMKEFKSGQWVFASEDWQEEVHQLGEHLRVRS